MTNVALYIKITQVNSCHEMSCIIQYCDTIAWYDKKIKTGLLHVLQPVA